MPSSVMTKTETYTPPTKLHVQVTESDIRNATLSNEYETPLSRAIRRTFRENGITVDVAVNQNGIYVERQRGGDGSWEYADYYLGPQARRFLALSNGGKKNITSTFFTLVRNGRPY